MIMGLEPLKRQGFIETYDKEPGLHGAKFIITRNFSKTDSPVELRGLVKFLRGLVKNVRGLVKFLRGLVKSRSNLTLWQYSKSSKKFLEHEII